MKNKLILLIMGLIVIVCGATLIWAKIGQSEDKTVSDTENSSDKALEEDADVDEELSYRTVIDHLGDEVQVPTNIERIVIDGIFPLPSVYVLFEGSVDKLVGMESGALSAAKGSLLEDMFPEIVNVSTEFSEGDDLNIEELLMLNPDVVFYRAETEGVKEKLSDAGIPAVGFSTAKFDFNTIETFNGWITLLGDVLDEEDKAAGIVEKAYESYDMVTERLEEITEEEKPSVLIINQYDENQLKVYGNNHFAEFWIESTGAVNAASDISGAAEINMEQIYEYNPDIIYISNFTPTMPSDLYENAINDHDWSEISAIKNERVHKFPLGMYRWYPPSSDVALVFQWLAINNHPELFDDLDIEEVAMTYYNEIFGLNVTEEQINKVFNPSREAGIY